MSPIPRVLQRGHLVAAIEDPLYDVILHERLLENGQERLLEDGASVLQIQH